MIMCRAVFLIVVAYGGAAATPIPLATFDGQAGTTFKWEAVNDPVMGGQSASTITIDAAAQLADWNGTVAIVPFLHAPGFCTVRTEGKNTFPDISSTAGLLLYVKSAPSTALTFFQAQLMTTGGRTVFKQGTYQANLTIVAGKEQQVFAPWADFELTWRGEKIDGPAITSQLDKLYQVGLGTGFPGKAGDFDLQLISIAAGDAPAAPAAEQQQEEEEEAARHRAGQHALQPEEEPDAARAAAARTAALAAGGGETAYPGPDFTHPRIHQSPDCLHRGGWHDMAGALTYQGVHHAFQGCPASGGWMHSTSTDLVHWKGTDMGVHSLDETYEGMESNNSPCSGFVAVDDNGTPCAGFRQCGSSKGTTGLNPDAHGWDVPMELRCASDDVLLTNWSAPIWMYPVYYYRALPYDPVRPWKDFDGLWYSSWSTDGCNATTKRVPCAAGGQLELLVSPALHGADADWKQLAPMFTTNTTVSGAQRSAGAITREFVTSGYFGGVPGDPDGGRTRVITQNNAGPTFWVGRQANGSAFEAYWDKPGAVGHYDYGSLTMARTLGSDPNQVAVNGRRVLIGWIGGGSVASQSLARDLTLSDQYELLQQFVPELMQLRLPGTHAESTATAADPPIAVHDPVGSLRADVVVAFSWTLANPTQPFGVSVLGGAQNITVDCTGDDPQAPGGCMVTVAKSRGPVMPLVQGGYRWVNIHAIVDHQIVETIVNNRTAMVTYGAPAVETDTAISLFGVDAAPSLRAHIQSWHLDAANN